jgi:hypothetical protein
MLYDGSDLVEAFYRTLASHRRRVTVEHLFWCSLSVLKETILVQKSTTYKCKMNTNP